MTDHLSRIGMACLGVLLLAAPLYAEEQATALKSGTDRESYVTGVEIVRDLQQRGGQIDLDLVIQGMKDGLTGENMLMSEDDLREMLASRKLELMEKQAKAANQSDRTRSMSSDSGRDSGTAAPRDQITPDGRPDQQAAPNAALALKDGQAQKTVQVGQAAEIARTAVRMSGRSVAEIDRARIDTKQRALQMRRKTLERYQREHEMAASMNPQAETETPEAMTDFQ